MSCLIWFNLPLTATIIIEFSERLSNKPCPIRCINGDAERKCLTQLNIVSFTPKLKNC